MKISSLLNTTPNPSLLPPSAPSSAHSLLLTPSLCSFFRSLSALLATSLRSLPALLATSLCSLSALLATSLRSLPALLATSLCSFFRSLSAILATSLSVLLAPSLRSLSALLAPSLRSLSALLAPSLSAPSLSAPSLRSLPVSIGRLEDASFLDLNLRLSNQSPMNDVWLIFGLINIDAAILFESQLNAVLATGY